MSLQSFDINTLVLRHSSSPLSDISSFICFFRPYPNLLPKVTKMLRREGAASAESSPSTKNGGQMQATWLSFGAPQKSYKCSLCHLSFHSMNALGGHQNAHRQHRNQMQKLIDTDRRSTNSHTVRGGASSKKNTFYQFIPLKEGHTGIYGYGGGFQNPLHHTPQLVTPAHNNGQSSLFRGGAGGGYLECSTSSDNENRVPFHGGLNNAKGASMNELDLTLKLWAF